MPVLEIPCFICVAKAELRYIRSIVYLLNCITAIPSYNTCQKKGEVVLSLLLAWDHPLRECHLLPSFAQLNFELLQFRSISFPAKKSTDKGSL